ncbi:MAG: hypothetical protein ACRBCI_03530 [Cellvibrionaceae bacterium]
MSSTVSLYITDESIFPTTLSGNDKEKQEWLINKVTSDTSRWESLELNTIGYMNALEAIGELAGSKKFFAVLSYNNSPHNCMGNNAEAEGSFGYFTPQMVKDGLDALQAITPEIDNASTRCQTAIETNSPLNQDTIEYVFYRYLSAFQEAAKRGYAISVIHE